MKEQNQISGEAVENTEVRQLPSNPSTESAEDFGRKFFNYEKEYNRGVAINIRGRSKKEGRAFPDIPAKIPDDTPSFKFGATYKNYPAGNYIACWRVKVLDNFDIPDGLRFSVSVTYDADPDTKDILDIVLPHEKLQKLERERLYDLELEALVTVQPHQTRDDPERINIDKTDPEKAVTEVDVAMSNCESNDNHYSGLLVEYVELKPFKGVYGAQRIIDDGNIIHYPVKKAESSRFTIDFMDTTKYHVDVNPVKVPSIPITRLAWSKDGTLLAALALWENSAYVTVWDMQHIPDPFNPPPEMGIFHQHCVVAVAKLDHGVFDNVPIGLAISPKGDMIAIYQEPKIGEWSNESRLEESNFKFCLFDNSAKHHTVLDLHGAAHVPAMLRSNGTHGSASAMDPRQTSNSRTLDRNIQLPHRMLKNFIGYGAFVTETDNSNWAMNDVKTATSHNPPADDHGHGKKCNGKSPTNDRSKQSNSPNALFIACSGIYIDVYKIEPEHKWDHSHSIKLVDLTPTLSRRITCKMMMEILSSNTFMWLEDGGQCCTVWDLQKGSNVAYLSITDGARLGSSVFRGSSKMAISPDESVVALTSADGILTTFYTNTGIMIGERKFPEHHIEYVAFNGRDNQLFVIVRKSMTLELSSWILDPLQLNSGTKANQVPVPIIGKSILAYFRHKKFKNKGLVCESDGSKIRFYVTHNPVSHKVDKIDNNLIKFDERIYPPPHESQKAGNESGFEKAMLENIAEDIEHAHRETPMAAQEGALEDIHYELRTRTHRVPFPDEDGSMYWVHRVEVFKRSLTHQDGTVIFSFVPEPWMRVSAGEIRSPEGLQKVFFLPGGKRFVVIGMQTLQIWSLPSDDTDFSLVFIWSHPRTVEDAVIKRRGKKYRSTPVGEYYHRIVDVKIYHDNADNTVADIKMRDGPELCCIHIPGANTSDSRNTFLHCIRSVHLLSDAYAYSTQQSKKFPMKTRDPVFTYEKHADAIARFTRGYINRLLSEEDLFPHPETDAAYTGIAPVIENNGIPSSSKRSDPSRFAGTLNATIRILSTSRKESPMATRRKAGTGISRFNPFRKAGDDSKQPLRAVTILTLLLDQDDLANANLVFVDGLFNTPGHEWIPHASMALNPIKRVIDIRNEHLVKLMIDYCMRCAKNVNLAYLEPVEQCLSDLLDRHPDIVASIFIKSSYIPAHNQAYIATHATDTNSASMTFGKVFNGSSQDSGDNDDNNKMFFTLPSQLPLSGSLKRREKWFPGKREPKTLLKNRSLKIYVSPFQFQPAPDDDGQKRESVFARIAGGDYFESPAIVVSLQYKWNKFGWHYWMLRFLIVFLFFILVVTITVKQIRVSTAWDGTVWNGTTSDGTAIFWNGTAWDGNTLSPEQQEALRQAIHPRYLEGWKPVFYAAIVMGLGLVLYELAQMTYSPSKYFMSPYNYIDLAAYICPVVGSFIFLSNEEGEIDEDTGIDGGPSMIWAMGFGILFLYLNMLFELRVFRQLGIVVNIIFNITRKIKWFFLVFLVFLVSFTHALLYILHTRRYRPCNNESCDGTDYPSKFPTGFWAALSAVYFFLSGSYDPVQDSFESGSVGFHIMMVVFSFFTVILLLNILIALMNDAFNASEQEGELAHLKLLSEVIAEVEVHRMKKSDLGKGDFYPKNIYYCATEEEASRFRSKHSMLDKWSLSPESRFILDESNEAVSKIEMVQNNIVHNVQDIRIEVSQELEGLRDLMKALVDHAGLAMPPSIERSAGRPRRATSSTAHRRSFTSTNSQNVPYSGYM